MKNREIDRRGLLGLTAAGAAALLLPRSEAFATNLEGISSAEVSQDVLASPFGSIITGDGLIDESNREALSLWSDAVKKATEEGSEIVTVINPIQEAEELARATRAVYTNQRSFTSGGTISIDYMLSLTYDVNANNAVSGFRNHNAYIMYGLYNASLSVVGYSYSIIDSGRTYAVYTNLYTSSNFAGVVSGAYFQKYSEYYYTGGSYLY